MTINVECTLKASGKRFKAIFKGFNPIYNTVTLKTDEGSYRVLSYLDLIIHEYSDGKTYVSLCSTNNPRRDLWEWLEERMRLTKTVEVEQSKPPKSKIMFFEKERS